MAGADLQDVPGSPAEVAHAAGGLLDILAWAVVYPMYLLMVFAFSFFFVFLFLFRRSYFYASTLVVLCL